jgi:hypothetical protein
VSEWVGGWVSHGNHSNNLAQDSDVQTSNMPYLTLDQILDPNFCLYEFCPELFDERERRQYDRDTYDLRWIIWRRTRLWSEWDKARTRRVNRSVNADIAKVVVVHVVRKVLLLSNASRRRYMRQL